MENTNLSDEVKTSISIIDNTPNQVTLEKFDEKESWDFYIKNLLKNIGRENDEIDIIRFDDGKYIGSILYVYLKQPKQVDSESDAEALNDLISFITFQNPSKEDILKQFTIKQK